MDATRLWCLRHAESLDNAAGVVSNTGPGRGLTEAGQVQAAAAAEALRAERITAVYASPARRAQETAAIVAGSFRLRPRTRPGLVECGVGVCEGRADAAARTLCTELVRAWVVDGDLDARISGGDSGRELSAKVTATLAGVADAHPGQSVAVVSHVAALTVGLMALCAQLRPNVVWGRPLPHAVPFLITYDRGTWQCPTWPA